MIILSQPKDLSRYICVNSEQSYILHSNGFFPKYKWEGNFYYEKTQEIEEFLDNEGE